MAVNLTRASHRPPWIRLMSVYGTCCCLLSPRSMDQEDELLSLAVMKHGRKLVVGTQVGSTNVHV
jgi:hypothetical protein